MVKATDKSSGESPFPGMDPYLESPAWWYDFHFTFVNYWSEAIADLLPDAYDVSLRSREIPIQVDDGVTLLELPTANYISIVDHHDLTPVTMLELLTLDDKYGVGRERYLATRQKCLQQKINLVELDLLVEGLRVPPGDQVESADSYTCQISTCDDHRTDIYTWLIQEPLPVIPIPLSASDSPVGVDLVQVFRTAYARGRYRRRVTYRRFIPSFLSEPHRQWALARIDAAGL